MRLAKPLGCLALLLIFLTAGGSSLAQQEQSAEEIYSRAEEHFFNDEFTKALLLFEAAYMKHPDSDLADDALFMKGMTEMRLEMFDDAIITFNLLKTEYPESEKAGNAQRNIDIIKDSREQEEKLREMMENITAMKAAEPEFDAVNVVPIEEEIISNQSISQTPLWLWLVVLAFLGLALYMVFHKASAVSEHRKRKKGAGKDLEIKKHK